MKFKDYDSKSRSFENLNFLGTYFSLPGEFIFGKNWVTNEQVGMEGQYFKPHPPNLVRIYFSLNYSSQIAKFLSVI